MKNVLLSWSSGRDSAWVLHRLRNDPDVGLAGVLTTVNASHDRVAMHATRRTVLEAQARAVGLDLHVVPISWPSSNEAYEAAMDRELDEEPACYHPRPPVPTKLDPYKPILRTRLEAYPELTAVRLLEEIQAAGYPGGYTQLKEYVRRVRPRPPPEPVVRFETPPGHQTQVDFADFRLPWGRRYALVVVLCYSRLLWLRFYPKKDMRALLITDTQRSSAARGTRCSWECFQPTPAPHSGSGGCRRSWRSELSWRLSRLREVLSQGGSFGAAPGLHLAPPRS